MERQRGRLGKEYLILLLRDRTSLNGPYVSSAGGKRDVADVDDADTALREAWEGGCTDASWSIYALFRTPFS